MFDDLDSFIADNAASWDYDASALTDAMTGALSQPTVDYGGGDPYNDLPAYESGSMGAGTAPGALTVAEEGIKTVPEEKSLLTKIGQGTGILNKNGDFDISDPKTLDKLIKLGLGVGSFIQGMANKGKVQGQQTAQQLQQQLVQKNTQWTPTQQQWANNFFYTPSVGANKGVVYAGQQGSSIQPGKGYADGGDVRRVPGMPQDVFNRTRRQREQDAGLEDYRPVIMQPGNTPRSVARDVPITDLIRSLPLLIRGLVGGQQEEPRPGYAEGGDVAPGGLTQAFSGYVQSDTGGQEDLFDIKVAGGEYVFDADSVAALGDGNNAAGAKILDEWRERLRSEKRSAPTDEIPPSTGALSMTMPGEE